MRRAREPLPAAGIDRGWGPFGRCAAVLLSAALLVGACDDGPTGVQNGDDPPNQPPSAAFTASPEDGPAPLTVEFDGGISTDPDGEIASWRWEFGDGRTGTGRVVTHEYPEPGYFVPVLTVTDDEGARDSAPGRPIVVTHSPGDGEGTIHGTVWHDRSGDGTREAGDPPMAGAVVFLDLDGNGRLDPGEPRTVTDAEGRYAFHGLDTDLPVTVTQELALGWTNTAGGMVSDGSAPDPASPAGRAAGDGVVLPIIGGTEVETGRYPFMVALLRSGISNNEQAFTCGGTFIASRWILTAAHCVATGDMTAIRPASEFHVLVGTHSLLSGGERVVVRRIEVFPAFGAHSFAGDDVALLELDGDFLVPRIALHPTVRPDLSAPRRPATAIGWGRTTRTGSISPTLREVELPLISNDECRRMLDESVVASTICAGEFGANRSICSGDSGGPLMVQEGGRWIQVGISSFARNCQPPVAFARTAEFTDWIRSRVPRESSIAVQVDWSGSDTLRVDFGNFR